MRSLVLASLVALCAAGSVGAAPLNWAAAQATCYSEFPSDYQEGDFGASATASCSVVGDIDAGIIGGSSSAQVNAGGGVVSINVQSQNDYNFSTNATGFSTFVALFSLPANKRGFLSFDLTLTVSCSFSNLDGDAELYSGLHHGGASFDNQCGTDEFITYKTEPFVVPAGGLNYEVAAAIFGGGQDTQGDYYSGSISVGNPVFTIIPEPSTAALLLSGLSLLCWRRRESSC